MKYTKQLVSGRDIDLTEHNLGIIKQLKVDVFMGELDVIDFVKPFYLERLWKVNEVLQGETPFTFFIAFSMQQPELLSELLDYLVMLYGTDNIKLEAFYGDEVKIVIRDNNDKMFAFIDDSNFDVLCETILLICNYSEPEKKVEEEIEGDKETLELFEKYEREYEERHRNKKKSIDFEEIVREVIHEIRGTYNDVKDWTVWQLQDAYKTYMYMENERFEKSLVASGSYKVDKNNPIKRWQDQTKIIRD